MWRKMKKLKRPLLWSNVYTECPNKSATLKEKNIKNTSPQISSHCNIYLKTVLSTPHSGLYPILFKLPVPEIQSIKLWAMFSSWSDFDRLQESINSVNS